jgi:NADPH-dependent 2,4-dienoyl-CoA reductase/sulfur reductase-like enzyme/rhodanese-related sulfurtransferase
MKVVVVGGVAGGMSFAARARRLAEDAQIVVLERDAYVSYANCGLPYHLAGGITDRSALLLHTPDSLAASLALDVRTGHEVVSIDPAGRVVTVREVASGRRYEEAYDALVLSTGAVPLVPPIPGVELPQVRALRTVPDVDALRALVDAGATRAVVAGAGFIGLEVAEALRHRGLAVTVVDLADQVLPPLDPEMARAVQQELTRAGIDVRLATSITGVRANNGSGEPGVTVDLSDGTGLGADLVLLAVGVRPETTLAAAAGLALGPRGSVIVDDHLRTSAPGVYAVGDAIEVVDAVTGAPASGPPRRLLPRRPSAALKLVFAPDGRVLGAQATGSEGVDKRIDVIATAIRAEMTVDDLAELELAYAPPFGSAKDPVNMAGFLAENVIAGDTALWRGADLDSFTVETVLLDVRSGAEYATGHLPGAVNIPHTKLRERLTEVPPGLPVRVYCASGFRSYLALRVLRQTGWHDVASLSGGLTTLRLERPDLTLAPGSAPIRLASTIR